MGQSIEQGGYATWTGTTDGERKDGERIFGQNTSEGRARWGIGHRTYLEFLQKNYLAEAGGFHPRRIAELGIGPDATLVINTLEVFGESLEEKGLVVFELDKKRLEAAKVRLREAFKDRPELFAKLDFVAGNAAETLGQYGEFDLIHAQLFFQHLLPHERRTILQNSAQHLSEGGLFVVSDIAFGDWTARASDKLRRLDPRRLQADFLALRDRRTIRRLRQVGYRRLGKKDFENAEEIEEMMTTESRTPGEDTMLEIVPNYRMQWSVTAVGPGEDEVEFMSQIPPRLAQGRRGLLRAANRYIRGMEQGTDHVDRDYPTMVRTAARRVPVSAT